MPRVMLVLFALLLFVAGAWLFMPRSAQTPAVDGRTGSGTSVYRAGSAASAAASGASGAPGAKFVSPPAAPPAAGSASP
jgi:hypothetical protein